MKRLPLLQAMFEAMSEAMGPSGWWLGAPPLAVAVGAVLTQNTAWRNVEQALVALEACGDFSARGLLALPEARFSELIRPAGASRVKTARLRHLLRFIAEDLDGDIVQLAGGDMADARVRLLAVKGIGPETADSILLYALGYPSFVVDAYTARICLRHGLVPEEIVYEELREFFMDVLPEDVAFMQGLHALFVRVGGQWCRPRQPRCATCPLGRFLS